MESCAPGAGTTFAFPLLLGVTALLAFARLGFGAWRTGEAGGDVYGVYRVDR
jgi:hypothetical protein